MMETPNGEKRVLTNAEITTVIKKLQDDNRRLNDSLQVSGNQAFQPQPTEPPQNKVFIFTDADDNMDVIEADNVNEYVTKQIQEIRDLREQIKTLTVAQENNKGNKQTGKQKTSSNTNIDVTQLLKTFKKEMLSEVKNTILTTMYGDDGDDTE